MLWFNTLGSSLSSSCRRSLTFQRLLILTSVVHLSLCLNPSTSVTIDQLPTWSQQRQCGKGCIQNNYDGGEDIENVLGCTWNGYYCGTQYQAAATSVITSCWSRHCASDANLLTYDISTAVSIYDAYCGIAAVAAATTPATAPVTATGNTLPTSATDNNGFPNQTGNVIAGATAGTPSATASSKSSSSLSLGGTIGIGLSVACSVLGLIFGVGFKIWKHKRAEKKNQVPPIQQRGYY